MNRQALWDQLCNALDKAATSFNHYYKSDGHAEFTKYDDGRAEVRYVTTRVKDKTLKLRLFPDGTVDAEVVTNGGKSNTRLSFALNEKNEAGLVLDGKDVTYEQASRALLEPIFFEDPVELNFDAA
ncbi:MAG TPA: hypothetical protein VFF64_24530 [Candidatus Eremiobacteraceae bacterium]|nr:hypothetical protein [Candidatus Eremiobacteraceae bacterium]